MGRARLVRLGAPAGLTSHLFASGGTNGQKGRRKLAIKHQARQPRVIRTA
jgi:hypothetical protein